MTDRERAALEQGRVNRLTSDLQCTREQLKKMSDLHRSDRKLYGAIGLFMGALGVLIGWLFL